MIGVDVDVDMSAFLLDCSASIVPLAELFTGTSGRSEKKPIEQAYINKLKHTRAEKIW